MDYNTKIYYCCDDFSKECDKNRKDVIVFGKPLKEIRNKISPYGDKEKNLPKTLRPNSVKIIPFNRGANIKLKDKKNLIQEFEEDKDQEDNDHNDYNDDGYYRDDLLSESWDEEDH